MYLLSECVFVCLCFVVFNLANSVWSVSLPVMAADNAVDDEWTWMVTGMESLYIFIAFFSLHHRYFNWSCMEILFTADLNYENREAFVIKVFLSPLSWVPRESPSRHRKNMQTWDCSCVRWQCKLLILTSTYSLKVLHCLTLLYTWQQTLSKCSRSCTILTWHRELYLSSGRPVIPALLRITHQVLTVAVTGLSEDIWAAQLP